VSLAHKPPALESEDSGDRRAHAAFVSALYRDHWADLCGKLRRLYGAGPPEPQDLAQIAFVKLIEIGRREAITNAAGYLFRIAVNAGLDAKRRIRRTRRFIDDELAHLEKDRVEEITPSNVYESRESLAHLAKALERLPEKQREVLIRSRLKGETYAEIAAQTGWSAADISRQLNAALRVLQDDARR
jgi:RNA polymerase sigma factor (sigma-70 family)